MKQFILENEPDKNGQIRLEGKNYHYLVRVRRLAPGEYFPALLPDGTKVSVQVLSIGSHALEGRIFQNGESAGKFADIGKPGNGALSPPLILFQALPKGEKMDLIVRQAAEGALAEIVPFASEFSAAKTGGQKFSRWERIIREARQQSGSAVETALRQPLSMDGLFAYWEDILRRQPGALGLLFHHLPLAQASLHGYLNMEPSVVVLTIGPEGGFSPTEADRFMVAGFKPFTIGDTIFRTETAALYAQAAVRILLLERDSWETKQPQI
jgi:16S rRNA (uracil1498-N3)-methyltransferase